MICGIYKITNIENNKFYIGSSVNIENRIYSHFLKLKNNNHENVYLQRAYNKYGKGSFIFEILEICNSSELLDMEQSWLDKTMVCNRDIGYNINKIANKPPSQRGKKFTKEHRHNMFLSNKNKKKVVWVETNMIFDGIREAARVLKVPREGIRDVCNMESSRHRHSCKKNHFLFYEDWLSKTQDDIDKILGVDKLTRLERASIKCTIEHLRI